MTKQLQVTDEAHERIMILKGVLGVKNVSAVIISLMKSRMYDDAFLNSIVEQRESGRRG